MSQIQGVIFDMDGLMFDTEPFWGSSWAPVIAEFGYDEVPEGMVVGVRGRAGETMLAAIRHYLGDDCPAEEIWENEKALVIQREREEGVPKKPGLDDLLEYLHDCGIPIAVASSSTIEQIKTNLAHGNVEKYFDVMLSGESLGRGKPDPLIFLETAKLLGTDPARTIVLEDAYTGVEAGWRGGFITIMVPDTAEPTDVQRKQATAIVKTLDEVIDLIEEGKIG